MARGAWRLSLVGTRPEEVIFWRTPGRASTALANHDGWMSYGATAG